jgi:hypothetical protein
MYCPQCRQLKDDLNEAQTRYDAAVDKLACVQRGIEPARALRLEMIEARLYLKMAYMELARHEVLIHASPEVSAAVGG